MNELRHSNFRKDLTCHTYDRWHLGWVILGDILCWASSVGSQHDATRMLSAGTCSTARSYRSISLAHRASAANPPLPIDETYGRTDARPLHRPCCAYSAGGVNKTASVARNRSSAYTRCSETFREVRLILSVADERARQVTHWPITRRDACRKVTTQQIAVVLVQDNMSQTASCNNRQW